MQNAMKVDAHQHFWSLKRTNDYGFLTPEAGVLYNDYLPGDLARDLADSGFDYSIAVQAAETTEETEWLFEITRDADFVAGVVGWLNMDASPDSFRRQLDNLRRYEKFLGVRPMLQGLDDDRFIVRPNVIENLKYLSTLNVPFEILVYPKHLPHVYEMLQAVPNLRAIIDHLAKPVIRKQEIEPWLTWMDKLGKFPNVWCKFSGMVTEADHGNWKRADFVPYVRGIVSSFGTDRLVFGSDWPVCLLAASYSQVVNLAKELVEELVPAPNAAAKDAIFGGNAIRFYDLKLPGKGIY